MSERIAFVAGEASGDLLAAPVVAALRRHDPPYAAAGIAGDRMVAAGCEAWHHVRELSVRGYVEVLRELPRLLRLRRGVFDRLVASRCAALVGVDSPDFNLALEAKARGAGIPTVHYVSPSIWAWRGGRIERIRKAADRVLLVFPFEQEIYHRAGIPASYVGHPMASEIPMDPDAEAARARLGLDGAAGRGSPIVALLPGSRRAEVEYIGPVFLDAAREIARAHPAARFLLPVADRSLRAMVESQIASRPEVQERLHWFDGRSHDCLEACDGVLVASGTATLEAALYKRPMVIAYRMPASSAWIMRRIGGYLPWVGLPNILAGEGLVDELLQQACTGESLAGHAQALLDDAPRRRRLGERFEQMHASLLRPTAALAAQAIAEAGRL